MPVVAETFRPDAPEDLKAIVASRRKLIVTPADNGVQMFDLERDPEEREDLASRDGPALPTFPSASTPVWRRLASGRSPRSNVR